MSLLNYLLHISIFFSDVLVDFFRIPNVRKVLLLWAVTDGDRYGFQFCVSCIVSAGQNSGPH